MVRHPRILAHWQGTNATSPNRTQFTFPSLVQAGDLLLVVMYLQGSGNTVTPPSGWSVLTNVSNPGGNIATWVLYKWGDGSEAGATISFATSASTYLGVALVVRDGTGWSYTYAVTTSSTTSLAWPSLSVQDGDLYVAIAHTSANGTYSLTPIALAQGLTTTTTGARGTVLWAGVSAGSVAPALTSSRTGYWNLIGLRILGADDGLLTPGLKAYTVHKVSGASSVALRPPPTAATRDLLVLGVVANQTITPPSGWAELVPRAQGGTGAWVGAWYRLNDGSAFNVTFGGSANAQISIAALPGDVSLQGANRQTIAQSSGAFSIPSPSGTGPNDLLLVLGGIQGTTSEVYAVSLGAPTSATALRTNGNANTPAPGPLLAAIPPGQSLSIRTAAGASSTVGSLEAVIARISATSTTYQRQANGLALARASGTATKSATRRALGVALLVASSTATRSATRRTVGTATLEVSSTATKSAVRRAMGTASILAASTAARVVPRRVTGAALLVASSAAALATLRRATGLALTSSAATPSTGRVVDIASAAATSSVEAVAINVTRNIAITPTSALAGAETLLASQDRAIAISDVGVSASAGDLSVSLSCALQIGDTNASAQGSFAAISTAYILSLSSETASLTADSVGISLSRTLQIESTNAGAHGSFVAISAVYVLSISTGVALPSTDSVSVSISRTPQIGSVNAGAQSGFVAVSTAHVLSISSEAAPLTADSVSIGQLHSLVAQWPVASAAQDSVSIEQLHGLAAQEPVASASAQAISIGTTHILATLDIAASALPPVLDISGARTLGVASLAATAHGSLAVALSHYVAVPHFALETNLVAVALNQERTLSLASLAASGEYTSVSIARELSLAFVGPTVLGEADPLAIHLERFVAFAPISLVAVAQDIDLSGAVSLYVDGPVALAAGNLAVGQTYAINLAPVVATGYTDSLAAWQPSWPFLSVADLRAPAGADVITLLVGHRAFVQDLYVNAALLSLALWRLVGGLKPTVSARSYQASLVRQNVRGSDCVADLKLVRPNGIVDIRKVVR